MKSWFRAERVTVPPMDCTSCRERFEDGLQFRSQAAAVSALEEAGWWLLETGRLCDWRAGRESCGQLDHAWGQWRSCRCYGVIRAHAE